MKILLLSDDAIRLEPDAGPMTIEAIEPEQQFSPFHMLASSLAYCTFSVLYSWATHSKQSVDDLVIEVRWSFTEEPKRVGELEMSYRWPSLPERKRDAARRVAELCTVHATLQHPPAITIRPADDADARSPGRQAAPAAAGDSR